MSREFVEIAPELRQQREPPRTLNTTAEAERRKVLRTVEEAMLEIARPVYEAAMERRRQITVGVSRTEVAGEAERLAPVRSR